MGEEAANTFWEEQAIPDMADNVDYLSFYNDYNPGQTDLVDMAIETGIEYTVLAMEDHAWDPDEFYYACCEAHEAIDQALSQNIGYRALKMAFKNEIFENIFDILQNLPGP